MNTMNSPIHSGINVQPASVAPGIAGQTRIRLRIDGMHCAACAANVERVLRSVTGVQSASVDAATARAVVTGLWSEPGVASTQMDAAVQAAGYRVTAVATGDPAQQARMQERQMLWRWLVAGFCMMQVMMYAWPTYGALPGEIDVDSDRLMRWASWVLTLPVLLFSAQPFWRAAWNDVRRLRVSMDLPVAMGIAVAFGASTMAVWQPQSVWADHLYLDAVTMLVFILLSGRWLEARLRSRTMGVLDDLVENLPAQAHRIKADGSLETVAIALLKPGELIRIMPGERIPADGVVASGQSSANEALLSGESQPVRKRLGDAVIAGSLNMNGLLEVRVDKLGQDTRFAQIVELMNTSAQAKPAWIATADRWAQPFLWCVLMAALSAGLFWGLDDPGRGLRAAITVLVVTCPCALALAAPAALMASMGALAREGVLLRQLSVIERLAKIRHVVFDKTGTLTDSGSSSMHVETRRGLSPEQALGIAALLAQHSTHPASQALMRTLRERGLQVFAHWRVAQAQEVAGCGLQAELEETANAKAQQEGAWVDLSSPLRLGSPQWLAKESEQAQTNDDRTPGAVTCLADAQGLLARFVWRETLRPDAQAACDALRHHGMGLSLCSGDRAAAVMPVAQQLGIDSEHVKALSSPQDKLAYLSALKVDGTPVAMVGDGINDGPVLAASDASFSLAGASGLAQLHADVILLKPQLHLVPHSLALARRCMRIMRQNMFWAVAYNATCVPLAWMGYLPPWLASLGMTLSSLAVLTNAMRLRAGTHASPSSQES
jgi:P-type Cu2+ transporter